MKLRIKWFDVVLPILFALLLTACASKAQPSDAQTRTGQATQQPVGSYTNISVEELQKMLANKDFTFVNVHIPFEGDIPDTDLSIPYDEIEQNLDRLPADKDARIVLYCRSGRMSSIAAEKLANQGYTNVQNLEGGMVAWEKADLPLLGR
jgi:rhodanese-related sulfurtransferase